MSRPPNQRAFGVEAVWAARYRLGAKQYGVPEFSTSFIKFRVGACKDLQNSLSGTELPDVFHDSRKGGATRWGV